MHKLIIVEINQNLIVEINQDVILEINKDLTVEINKDFIKEIFIIIKNCSNVCMNLLKYLILKANY